MLDNSFEMKPITDFSQGENNMPIDKIDKISKLISKSSQYAPSPVNLFQFWPCRNDHDKISMNQENLKRLRKVEGSVSGESEVRRELLLAYLKQALDHYSCALELNIQGSTFFQLNKSHIELAAEIVEANIDEDNLEGELNGIREKIQQNSEISNLTLCGEVIVPLNKPCANFK
jgi:hypothetical protein